MYTHTTDHHTKVHDRLHNHQTQHSTTLQSTNPPAEYSSNKNVQRISAKCSCDSTHTHTHTHKHTHNTHARTHAHTHTHTEIVYACMPHAIDFSDHTSPDYGNRRARKTGVAIKFAGRTLESQKSRYMFSVKT